MIKILFVITRLGGGGAERVMSYIINQLASNHNYQITLLLFKESGNSYLSMLPNNIEVVNLRLNGRIRYSILKIVKAILRIRPQICFSGLDKLNILLAFFVPIFRLKGIRTIVRETNVLSMQYNPKNPFVKTTYRWFYNLYDKIIAQSDDMKNDLINSWGIKDSKICLINNPVDICNIQNKASNISDTNCKVINKTDCFNFVAVGRLTYQKGYDILFQRVNESVNNTSIHISIIGTGELEYELKDQIAKLGIEKHVTLIGFKENPYAIMAEADGIILSSRYEGFPNALLEANALGIPILSNNCPGGINEIIVPGVNGMVCNFENSEEFQHTLKQFINTSFDRKNIINLTTKRYSFAKIIPLYMQIFESLNPIR